ncbi:hypothetical protein A9Q73_06105 [Bermanella sp. 47_1433_sub80_T6]|nr:hypothetical protein A9Q73_06105 [Bermanella sp. 47_1433_sub80_T6]
MADIKINSSRLPHHTGLASDRGDEAVIMIHRIRLHIRQANKFGWNEVIDSRRSQNLPFGVTETKHEFWAANFDSHSL